MKKYSPWLFVLLASLSPALAQVSVEVVQDQDQFLPGESVPIAVRITNRSGQTLRLGDEDNWLTFSIEFVDGQILARLGDVPVTGEFFLESSKVATKRVDLAPYFPLSRPGHYSLTATVNVKDWGRNISSRAKSFDVIQGAKLWEQEFGVPNTAAANGGVPEVRRYILQEANHLKGRLRLYLRLTDASGMKVSRVTPIGPLVSYSRPEAQVDRESNLHVLFADGPRTSIYTSFNPEGELIARRAYEYVESRPRLLLDADGKVSVSGGVRRPRSNDLPPDTAAAPDEVKKP